MSKVGTLSGLVVVPDSDLQTAGTQHITVEEMTGDARVAGTLLLEFEDLGLVLAPCVDPRNSPTEGAFRCRCSQTALGATLVQVDFGAGPFFFFLIEV